MKVVKGLRKVLHPPELMVWINCGMDRCGLDKHESHKGFEEIITSSKMYGLVQLWLGSMKVVKGLSRFLEWGASPPNPPGFVALRATTHSARRSL